MMDNLANTILVMAKPVTSMTHLLAIITPAQMEASTKDCLIPTIMDGMEASAKDNTEPIMMDHMENSAMTESLNSQTKAPSAQA